MQIRFLRYSFCSFAFLILALTAPLCLNADEPEIIGNLSDGVPSVPPVAKANSPSFEIVDSVSLRKGGRGIVMNRVKALEKSTGESEVVLLEPTVIQDVGMLSDVAEQSLWFTVSATVYDGAFSFVTWWSHNAGKQEKFSAWSNVDWSHLGGMSSFRISGQKFDYLLLQSNGSLADLKRLREKEAEVQVPEIPSQLQALEEGGPLYALMEGDETNADAMNFMEGIHELYALKSEELKEAHVSRVKQNEIRLEELRLNPPEKQDVTIQYWPGTGAREILK